MIPAFFRRMESFPQTITGKIDRKSLPSPDELESAAVEPPANEIEARVASIWTEVLGRPAVGVTSPYHEIGGTSLKAIQIISRLYRSFGLEISIRDFIEQDTIRKMAAFISRGAGPGERIERAGEQEHYELSHPQRRLWIQCQIESEKAAFNMAGVYEIEGAVDLDVLPRAYALVIRRHESLRTSFVVVDGEPRQSPYGGVLNGSGDLCLGFGYMLRQDPRWLGC